MFDYGNYEFKYWAREFRREWDRINKSFCMDWFGLGIFRLMALGFMLKTKLTITQ